MAGAIGAIWLYFGLPRLGSAAPRQVDLSALAQRWTAFGVIVLGKFFVERLAAPVALWVASN